MIRHVVTERDSTRVKALRRLNRPGSQAVVLARPPTRRVQPSHVWRFALVALGKSLELSTSYASGFPLSAHFQAWAAVYRIDTLVVLDVQRYGPSVLAALPDIAAAANLDLWLIEHEPVSRNLALILDQHTLTETTVEQLDELTDTRAAVPAGVASPTADDTFPWVPNVAGSRFLAQARLSVDAATMPIVDTAFNEAYDWALEATAAPWRTDCLERVARRWRRLLAAAHHPDRAITYARGLQAAADESPGWNVRVNAARIRACRCVDQRRAPSQADWAALHRYVRTDIPAICALTGSGVPAEVVGRLQVTDIASDHATVVDSLTGGTYAVTAPGRPLLQSHVAFRQFADPGATGRLFYAFEPATGATAARRCQRLAERAASDVGFHDALNWGIDINVPDDDFVSWASSTGLSISHTASNPVARVPDAKADAA